MPTYQRETTVEAPFADVWRFHATVEGLEGLTPSWMGLRVEGLTGPDGASLSVDDTLEAGSEIRLSVRPFGVGPRQSWTSRIDARSEGDGVAFFRDTMHGGPFRRWEHTHVFHAVDGGTRVRDRVEYAFPTPLGPLVDRFAWPGFEAMFRHRHRRTRALLEEGARVAPRG